MKNLLIIAIVCITALSSYSDVQLMKHSIPLPKHGTLVLSVPDTWELDVDQPSVPIPPYIVFTLKEAKGFRLSMNPIWSPHPKNHFSDPEFIKGLVDSEAQNKLPDAKESEVNLIQIKGQNGTGFYFILSEKNPKSTKRPFAFSATIGVGDIVLKANIKIESKDSEEIQTIINALESATHEKEK